MRLEPTVIPDWPKLAWVAEVRSGEPAVRLLHGPMVEVAQDWAAEAVWAGDFAAGDFDGTDLVFGTGVRCREGDVIFVSCGTPLDRLWHCRQWNRWHVSNSLPALLAVTGLSLRLDHDYATDIATIRLGLDMCRPSLPTKGEDLHVTYFNNLRFDGHKVQEIEKPDAAPVFGDYATYYGFLTEAARRLGANLADPRRRHAVVPLASISSGYDSPAAAVIARQAGCRRTATIEQSTSLWRGSDSGAGIARLLGMSCRTYPRKAARYPHEESVWAMAGNAGILSWTLFDYSEPLCIFFHACHGDKAWGNDGTCEEDPFAKPSIADLGFNEFRLIRGVFQCQVPVWGIRHLGEIRAVTLSPEMAPWSIGGDYDRPIPRRIIEQAGVPRGCFALRKKNTSTEAVVRWPHSPSSAASFARYLRRHGLGAPPPPTVYFLRWADLVDRLLCGNLLGKVGLDFGLRYHMRPRGSRLLFQWANSELADVYDRGLLAAGVAPSPRHGEAKRAKNRPKHDWPHARTIASRPADGLRSE